MVPTAGRRSYARTAVLLCLATATAVVAGCSRGTAGQAGPATPSQNDYEHVIKQVLPSVVEIDAGNLTGSGVVFDSRNDIVTNAHVLGNASTIQVIVSTTAKPLPARVVGIFAPDDIAVIRVIDQHHLRTVRWADSARTQVGQVVLAVGSPFGLIDSVTEGIISATNRTVTGPAITGRPPTVITDALQTSAAINPGNSGGALVALSGEVIGIPTLAARGPDLGGTASGIGFAIPSNTIRQIADQLIKTGHVRRSDRASLQFKGSTDLSHAGAGIGVTVHATKPDGAAAIAGIKAGDVILSVDGDKTESLAELENLLIAYRPGQRVQVEVRRHGRRQMVFVKLGSLTSQGRP